MLSVSFGNIMLILASYTNKVVYKKREAIGECERFNCLLHTLSFICWLKIKDSVDR